MLRFIVGALTGAAAVTYWLDLARMRDERLVGLRHRAASQLEALEDVLVNGLDELSTRISSVLRSWQIAMRGVDGACSTGSPEKERAPRGSARTVAPPME
jgi:hypothetical protein